MKTQKIIATLLASIIVFSTTSFANVGFFMFNHPAKTMNRPVIASNGAAKMTSTNTWTDLGWPTTSQFSSLDSMVFDSNGNLYATENVGATSTSFASSVSVVEYVKNAWTTISPVYSPTTNKDGAPGAIFFNNGKLYALFAKLTGSAPFYTPYQLSIYQYSGSGTTWTLVPNSSMTTKSGMVIAAGPFVMNGVVYIAEENPITSTAYIQSYNIANNTWGNNISMPMPSGEMAIDISNDAAGNLYVEYGLMTNDGSAANGIEVYNSVTGIWNTTIPSAATAFAGYAPTLYSPAYFVGQQNTFYSVLQNTKTYASAIYQNAQGVWGNNNSIALPANEAGPFMMSADNTGDIYALMEGGSDGTTYDIEHYVASSSVWENLGSGGATATFANYYNYADQFMISNAGYLYAVGTEKSNGALTLLKTPV